MKSTVPRVVTTRAFGGKKKERGKSNEIHGMKKSVKIDSLHGKRGTKSFLRLVLLFFSWHSVGFHGSKLSELSRSCRWLVGGGNSFQFVACFGIV